jgi:hypothetical protein
VTVVLPKRGAPVQLSSRSLKAEHPPDKRATVERYHAGRPFPESLDGVVSLHAGLKSRRCRCKSDSSGQYLSVNAKQPERPALQAGPSRCESGHGCHALKV